MVSWRRGKRVFLFVGVLFLISSSIWAASASRIELKDGTVYENVTFNANNIYKVLSVKGADWKKEISFTDIKYILDEKGTDVTEDYLGAYANKVIEKENPGKENWLSKTDPVTKSRNKPPWGGSLSLNTNFSMPTSDYYEGITSGFGFGGDVSFAVSRSLAVRLSVSKSGMKDDAAVLAPKVMSNTVLLEDNLSANVWRYFLSFEYYGGLKRDEKRKAMYYIYSGLGAINHSFSGNMLVRDLSDNQIYILAAATSSETKFTVTNGVGVVAFVSNSFGFEFGATADVVFVGSNDNYSYQPYGNLETAFVFDLKAGIVTMF